MCFCIEAYYRSLSGGLETVLVGETAVEGSCVRYTLFQYQPATAIAMITNRRAQIQELRCRRTGPSRFLFAPHRALLRIAAVSNTWIHGRPWVRARHCIVQSDGVALNARRSV